MKAVLEYLTAEQKLANLLLQERLISPDVLAKAQELRRSTSTGQSLVEILYQVKGLRPSDLAAVLARMVKLPLANLQDTASTDPEARALLPEPLARRYHALPLRFHGDTLVLAVGDPLNLRALEEMRTYLRRRVELQVAPIPEIQDTITLLYRADDEIEREVDRFVAPEEGARVVTAEEVTDTPVVRTVNLLLAQAVKDRASDVHIEPQRDRVRVRYRIDGTLHEMLSLPLSVHAPLVSRIKVMAEMKLTDGRHPQDGQLTVRMDGQDVDVRVATAESVHGEVVVMRILNRRASFLTLTELGFSSETMAVYERLLKHPFGMILIAGPTGSGKTTTLYASLNQMDRQRRNIMTIEDPVEYRFDGITQLQVSQRYGLTFATGLRALMRLDPDVILVGEIRDPDTAEIATQAALTGHVVLSSIHANDSASAIFRLLNLGADRFVASASLLGIVAQRMVRRVCPHCATEREGTEEERAAYSRIMGEERSVFLCGVGCSFCSGTGYLGRTGIFEILEVNEGVQRFLFEGATAAQIREHAIRNGMVTMLRDGMQKAQQGITTPGEVLRHVYGMS